MKPDKEAVEILITEDPNYPEGLYAYVDYDYDPDTPSDYCQLKWVCEDKRWQKLLTSTLSHLNPASGVNHFFPDHPNPPYHAAKYASERFGIKILSEGVTHETGPIFAKEK